MCKQENIDPAVLAVFVSVNVMGAAPFAELVYKPLWNWLMLSGLAGLTVGMLFLLPKMVEAEALQ